MTLIPIDNQMKTFKYKGRVLSPLTEVEICGLQENDLVKYIGPLGEQRIRGEVFDQWSKTVVSQKHFASDLFRERTPRRIGSAGLDQGRPYITLPYYYRDQKLFMPTYFLALCEKGNPHSHVANKAKRYVPQTLTTFKGAISRVQKDMKKKLDRYLNELPMQHRLEILTSLTKDQQEVLDFVYHKSSVDIFKQEDG